MKTTHPRIITLPDPLLRQVSADADATATATAEVIEAMHRAIADWEAHREHEITVALAAVQIAVPLRVVVVRHSFKDKADETYDVYLNPTITRHEGQPATELEGCLSVKDMYIEVARYPRIKIRATRLDGSTVKFIAKGFLARVFQHEIDHTHGITTVDRALVGGEICRLGADGQMQPLRPVEQKQFLAQVKPLSARDLDRRLS